MGLVSTANHLTLEKAMNSRKIISRLAIGAGICILAMFFVAVFTGVSQEQFEINESAETYKKSLIAAEPALRLIMTIDIVFICLFTALFVFLTQHLKTVDRINRAVADTSLIILVTMAVLDLHEDLHILTMLHSAVKGLPVEQGAIATQMLLSALKFCLSYLGLFLLAFILPGETVPEKILRYSLWFFLPVIGALVYTAPEQLQLLFNLIRFVFMVSGFFLLAYIFRGDD